MQCDDIFLAECNFLAADRRHASRLTPSFVVWTRLAGRINVPSNYISGKSPVIHKLGKKKGFSMADIGIGSSGAHLNLPRDGGGRV